MGIMITEHKINVKNIDNVKIVTELTEIWRCVCVAGGHSGRNLSVRTSPLSMERNQVIAFNLIAQ